MYITQLKTILQNGDFESLSQDREFMLRIFKSAIGDFRERVEGTSGAGLQDERNLLSQLRENLIPDMVEAITTGKQVSFGDYAQFENVFMSPLFLVCVKCSFMKHVVMDDPELKGVDLNYFLFNFRYFLLKKTVGDSVSQILDDEGKENIVFSSDEVKVYSVGSKFLLSMENTGTVYLDGIDTTLSDRGQLIVVEGKNTYVYSTDGKLLWNSQGEEVKIDYDGLENSGVFVVKDTYTAKKNPQTRIFDSEWNEVNAFPFSTYENIGNDGQTTCYNTFDIVDGFVVRTYSHLREHGVILPKTKTIILPGGERLEMEPIGSSFTAEVDDQGLSVSLRI